MGADVRVRNVAGVMVTATLPAFVNTGARIDVDISSIGDASSLKGGTLLMTPLTGADGLVYAVAQGPIAVSGFAASGAGASVSQGVPTDGRIPNGAIVEREVAGSLDGVGELALELFNPDYKTATLISDAINRATMQIVDPRPRAEDDDGAVVHRVLEHRAGEHDPVEQRDREARREPLGQSPQGTARRRAVDVDRVSEPRVQGRDHERLPVEDEAQVRDERRVEHGVDRLAVVAPALGKPAHARARGGSGMGAPGHRPKPTGVDGSATTPPPGRRQA